MAHIVILVGDYYPTPSANGICIGTIIEEFVCAGHLVDVICNGRVEKYKLAEHKGATIHTVNGVIPKSFFRKAIRKILSYPRLIYWPLNYPWKVRQMLRLFDRINALNPVDLVLSVQKPSEASEVGAVIAKKYPGVKTALYVLDSVANNLDIKSGFMKAFRMKSERAELRWHKCYGTIFHMEFNRFYYGVRDDYQAFRNKIVYLNLPCISEEAHSVCTAKRNKLISDGEYISEKKICFIYAGALGVGFRDPSLIMNLLANADKRENIVCDFYTRTDISKFRCAAYDKHPEMFEQHDFIPQEELYNRYAEIDFLLSIGNPCSDTVKQVPSKIFTYMSTGLPIVNFLGGEDDICIDYLNAYGNCLMINPQDRFEDNLKKLNKFIETNYETFVSYEDVVKKFEHNTPKWSADRIVEAVGI